MVIFSVAVLFVVAVVVAPGVDVVIHARADYHCLTQDVVEPSVCFCTEHSHLLEILYQPVMLLSLHPSQQVLCP